MAKFVMTLPTDILKEVEDIAMRSPQIFGEMTRAGAEVAAKHIRTNTDGAFDSATARKLKNKLKITKTYDTPSNGGINTKVAFYGYIPKEDGRAFKIKGKSYPGVPAPLLAALREFGASSAGSMPAPLKRYWRKKRFVAPAFERKEEIRQAMLSKQKEMSKGLLEND